MLANPQFSLLQYLFGSLIVFPVTRLDIHAISLLQVEALDFALRSKNEASSLAKLDSVRSSLDAILAFVG